MQLVISKPISSVSNSRLERDIIKLHLNTMWFRWKKLNVGVLLEVTEVAWQIILKRFFKYAWEEKICIDLAQDGDNRLAFVNTV